MNPLSIDSIVESHIKTTKERLSKVPNDVLKHFEDKLGDIENEREMLIRALAYISGYKDSTKFSEKSLIF
jgi:hypothetical protein